MQRSSATLSDLARLGFTELSPAQAGLEQLAGRVPDLGALLPAFAAAADPDGALLGVLGLLSAAPAAMGPLLADPPAAERVIRLLGASGAFTEYFLRNSSRLTVLAAPFRPPVAGGDGAAGGGLGVDVEAELLDAVGATDGVAALTGDDARVAVRVCYRQLLARLAAWDLSQPDPLAAVDVVATALSDLAGAALEASLAVGRAELLQPTVGRSRVAAAELAATRLAIVGMGKAGARELNYVSDVDVIFVVEATGDLPVDRAVTIGTRLAVLTMRGIDDLAVEPALWEVDANLRPEGKDGALVRTLESHLAYYDRWAKNWEFQALLKARPLAGDRELGARYVAGVAPKVWSIAAGPDFVEQVQRMRERVTANIPAAEADRQLKLGAGGLRDIEFTVQLLQLVHGQSDPTVRQRATLPALNALAAAGYIGRTESADFARDYRALRLLEHRLQLRNLTRTHLMPESDSEIRTLARGSGLAANAAGLREYWAALRLRVRSLHERLFYRPLLSAVARLPEEDLVLTSAQAEARLAAIGFSNPRGALGHIGALTQGVSRRAVIQRHLLPVLLQWFAQGADPDAGLLAFRRISESLGQSHWYLRMLRDSSAAGHRMTQVLAGSPFVVDLLAGIPESARWFENDDELRPRSWSALREETTATVNRHAEADSAVLALRTARRREVLRLAISAMLGFCTVQELGRALAEVTSALLTGVLRTIRREEGPWPEFAIIAMGRYGGAELGFGSDADVMYVYRPLAGMSGEFAQSQAEFLVAQLKKRTEDSRLPLDLDPGLRPEGKNGAIVRSLRSYEAYYERWSLTWEAQALLRARGVAGDHNLLVDFTALIDRFRYPTAVPEAEVREIKRIKARVESERLPQGADPARHLKLGRGSLSDVEWLVQLLQLQHAARIPALRTPSTLAALDVAAQSRLLTGSDRDRLREAWLLSARARSALTLWLNRTADLLPTERHQLEGVARLMEYPPGSATLLEEDYLRVTRRSRAVFERLFYGVPERPRPPSA